MAAESTASRDPVKERYWRQKLKLWRESGMSQAQFCKEHNLNANTLSSWKYIIKDRDILESSAPPSSKEKLPPTFARIELAEAESVATPSGIAQSGTNSSMITAELINAETGMKLRIFSGADQATLAAVLSAWSGR